MFRPACLGNVCPPYLTNGVTVWRWEKSRTYRTTCVFVGSTYLPLSPAGGLIWRLASITLAEDRGLRQARARLELNHLFPPFVVSRLLKISAMIHRLSKLVDKELSSQKHQPWIFIVKLLNLVRLSLNSSESQTSVCTCFIHISLYLKQLEGF